jgi:ACR3 family arsenite efflux pump ArsB
VLPKPDKLISYRQSIPSAFITASVDFNVAITVTVHKTPLTPTSIIKCSARITAAMVSYRGFSPGVSA